MHRSSIWILGLILTVLPALSVAYRQSTAPVDKLASIHNKYRRVIALSNGGASNMKKMIWDRNLEEEATKKASCDNTKTLLNPSTSSFEVDFMEEMSMYSTNADLVSLKSSLNSIVRSWFRESLHYIPSLNMCQPGKDCSHYTQMAAAEAERIGCAVNPYCVNGRQPALFIVCLYSPGIESRLDPGQPLYSSGASCTRCQNSTPFCEDGLCVSCRGPHCDCRKTCARNGHGEGKLNKTTCTCKCEYGNGPNCDEPCEQPEMYADYYDPCGEITNEDCDVKNPDRALIMQFCPTACACTPMPKQTLHL
ncbi:GLIPR1-like protein 1 [Lineus longissimus]|uniref:GLIPR1-like protein 1 n=1 Tax=Lineus longissimus TaxID=88925 RepID=UPI002B4D9C40